MDFSDIELMDMSTLMPIITQVVKDWRVIVATIVMVLTVSLANYVVSYRKKPIVLKTKQKSVAKAPKPAKKQEGEEGEASASEGKDDSGEETVG